MKHITTALALSLFLLACDKNDDDEQTDNTSTIASSSSWKYDSGGADVNGDGNIDVDVAAFGVQACALDNTVSFTTGGTGTADEGPTKCDPALPQSTAFNWNFLNNQSNLFIGGTGLFGFGGQFKIRELTNARLSLSKDTTATFGTMTVSGTIIVNLKH